MTSKNIAKDIIKQFEGLRLTSYRCPAGLLTIGYGHVIKPHELKKIGNTITEREAEKLLEQDIAVAKSVLYRNCRVYLNSYQKAALISFIFNCGSGAFQASTLRQKLNRGEYRLAADELLRWINCKGVKLHGLIKRRALERAIFLNEINISSSKIARGITITSSNEYSNKLFGVVVAPIKALFSKLLIP